MPKGITGIGKAAFAGCSGLTGELKLPEGITSIGYDAFSNCRGFSGELKLPESITSIGYGAFNDCCFTGDLKLPQGLTTIDEFVFRYCVGFEYIVLGENIVSVKENAFAGCANVKQVCFKGDAFSNITFLNEFTAEIPVYYPASQTGWEEVVAANSHINWIVYDGKVPDYIPANPTPTPTPVPTATPTPVPTATPTPVPTASPTPVPTVTPTPIPTVTPTSVPTATPTPVPTATPTPVPTASPTVTPTPVPTVTPTPVPTVTPTPVPTASPTPVPTVTPKPVPTATPTPVPTVTPTPKPTTTPVPTDEPKQQVNAFVERMYTVALGRAAEADGLQYWSNRLLSGENDGASIAHGFLLSPEFVNKNHSDSDYVKVLYATFFDRVPAQDEVSYWTGKLAGGNTREFVLAGFVNSNEFDGLCSDYGISRGFMQENGTGLNPGIIRFAERLYTKALEREGEKEGIEYWALQIANGACIPEAAAKSFFQSPEYQNKNTTDEQYIKALYRTFMDREAEADGVVYWQNVMNNGATREAVLAGFADSNEFKRIMESYGL